MINPTSVTLVIGKAAGVREAAIAAILIAAASNSTSITTSATDPPITASTTAIILEGMPDGTDPFASIANNPTHLSIVRIAPGCPCCIGNLTMRVALNRILRRTPQKLYISLATHEHIEQLRAFLLCTPYDTLLRLTKDIHV